MEERFQKIKTAVEKELVSSAHDMNHIMRVYNLAITIAESENADMEVIKAATLLHDIAREKEDQDTTGNIDHAILSAEMAEPILKELNFSKNKIKHIQDCIRSHRYRTNLKPTTKEAEIVFDADKLETIGAIGVARAFAWVGKHGAHLYKKCDLEEYAKENLGGNIKGRIQDNSKHSVQINWETKEKYVLEFLHTDKAKTIGKERKEYYENFLNRLEKEINGEL